MLEGEVQILSRFKYLERVLKYWLAMHQRYGCGVNISLLKLGELTILEHKLRSAMPLSKDLRFISLACEGLQKKSFYV
jgi:hypothetical protein